MDILPEHMDGGTYGWGFARVHIDGVLPGHLDGLHFDRVLPGHLDGVFMEHHHYASKLN